MGVYFAGDASFAGCRVGGGVSVRADRDTCIPADAPEREVNAQIVNGGHPAIFSDRPDASRTDHEVELTQP